MKKFLVIIAVLALTVISSVAMAEVTVSGSVDIRSLHLNNYGDFTDKANDNYSNTQERIRVNIDAKNDNVKGRVTFENDWEVWGTETNNNSALGTAGGGNLLGGKQTGVEARQAQSNQTAGSNVNRFGIREGWIDFTIPGAQPAHVKVGHQFLQLGNGWFFRSMKYGSDAWLVGLPGKNTVAFVDVKAGEGSNTQNDDIDAYVILDNFKIDDTKTVGIYLADVKDRRNTIFGGAPVSLGTAGTEANLYNLGLWFNGKLGPLNLQAEIDMQSGTAKGAGGSPDDKFKGTQVVVQGNMPVSAASVNFTLAQGSGQKTTATQDMKAYIPILDSDPHYTVVYEYFAPTTCLGTMASAVAIKNTGFCNTTAINIGGAMDVAKWLNISLDIWNLKATEKVLNRQGQLADDIGNEIDLVFRFKLYDQLTWNWQVARLMPGKVYDTVAGGQNVSADSMDAIQGILSYKF